MATQVTNLEDPRQLEAVVDGPDGANRLFLCTGTAPIAQEASSGTVAQTWTWQVGPVLGPAQFRGATVQGAIIRFSVSGGSAIWSLMGMDADWNDESGQVEVRAQVQIIAQGLGISARVQGISYQVNILAAVSPEPDKAQHLAEQAPAAAATPSVGGKESIGEAAPAPATPPPTTPERTPPPAPPPPLRPPLPLQGAAQQGAAQPAESKPPSSAAASAATVLIERIPGQPGLGGAAATDEKNPRPPAPPTPPPPTKPAPSQVAPQARQPVLVLSPQVVEFGVIPVGGFRVKTLTVSNTGSGDSGPLEMTLAGADAVEFTVTPDAMASVNLPPGASGHVLISFQPASAGPKTVSLQLRTSAGAQAEAAIVASGG